MAKEEPQGPFTFRMSDAESALGPEYTALVAELTEFINSTQQISFAAEFNAMLRGVAEIIDKHQEVPTLPTPIFDKGMTPEKRKSEFGFNVPWGRVTPKDLHTEDDDHYDVRKFLIIQQKGMLGFEYHKKKHEELLVKEGLCIGISSTFGTPEYEKGQVTLTFMKPGDHCVLEPLDNHGVIALTKCVLEETASDDTGSDLYFIFPAEQVIDSV